MADILSQRHQGEQQVAGHVLDEWRFDPVHDRLPAQSAVVIVGGGIVGCAAAWYLARHGVPVLLLEKGRIGGEQSGRNWGWVRQQGRARVELPLMMRSLDIWKSFTAETGEVTGFAQGGCLYLGRTVAELDALCTWLETAREAGLDTQRLDRAALARVLRDGGAWAGALYTASDGRAEPHLASPAFARAAVAAGARVVSHCAVRGLERVAGEWRDVVTEHGVVKAQSILVAAGAWSREFARMLGIDLPQLRVRGTVARTAAAPAFLDGCAWSDAVALRRRRDGGYTVAHGSAFEHFLEWDSLRLARMFFPALRQEHGSIRMRLFPSASSQVGEPSRAQPPATVFERERMLAPLPSAALLGEIRRALGKFFPALTRVPIVETWAGMIETSPDVLPIISGAESNPGLAFATGFSGHGFGLGPAAGELAARMMLGASTACELEPFRLSRFFDGTPIVPGPTI
ncbi:MAG: FAD-binding oxidoreductase [Steroidobacteraceae bacterium]